MDYSGSAISKVAAIEQMIRAGDMVGGERAARELLAATGVQGGALLRGEAMRCMALAQNWRGDYGTSLSSCLGAIELLESQEAHSSHAHAMSLAGVNLARLGEATDGVDYLSRALELARRSGAKLIEAQTLVNLGIVYEMLRDYRMAIEVTSKARDLATELANEDLWSATIMNLSGFYLDDAAQQRPQGGNVDAQLQFAAELADTAFQKFYEMGNEAQCSVCLENKGEALALLRQFDAAHDALQRSRELAVKTGARDMEAASIMALGNIYAERREFETAKAHLEEALRLNLETEDQDQTGRSWLALSKVHEAQGDFERALQCYREFHECANRMLSEKAESRARVLTLRLDIERTRGEAEMNRLRAIELAIKNEKLAAEAALLNRHAYEDSLTGLPNRRYLNNQLAESFAACKSAGRPLYLAIADVDHFKLVNDTHSHAVGDQVLQQLAKILIEQSRPTDFVGRLGGEEFVVIFDCESREQACLASERLRRAVEEFEWSVYADELALTISIGVAAMDDHKTAEQLLSSADAAMYRAKHAGRNQVAALEPRLH